MSYNLKIFYSLYHYEIKIQWDVAYNQSHKSQVFVNYLFDPWFNILNNLLILGHSFPRNVELICHTRDKYFIQQVILVLNRRYLLYACYQQDSE